MGKKPLHLKSSMPFIINTSETNLDQYGYHIPIPEIGPETDMSSPLNCQEPPTAKPKLLYLTLNSLTTSILCPFPAKTWINSKPTYNTTLKRGRSSKSLSKLKSENIKIYTLPLLMLKQQCKHQTQIKQVKSSL